jgi:hypothetical protein
MMMSRFELHVSTPNDDAIFKEMMHALHVRFLILSSASAVQYRTYL